MATRKVKTAVKAVMEDKRDPGTILTNARLEELKSEWEAQYYADNSFLSKEDILSCVQALTDRILSGEIVPEGVDK